jgi:hypothetical protein
MPVPVAAPATAPRRLTVECDEQHVAIFLHIRVEYDISGVGCWPGSKMIGPSSHGFIGDRDSAFRQQILDVAEAQSESGIQPDRLLNDHGRKAVTGVADFDHHGGQAPEVKPGKRRT